MLDGQEFHVGDKLEAVLYDDNHQPQLRRGTVGTAAAVGAAGTSLWVTFEGFHDFTLVYLKGSGVPLRLT